MKSILYILCFSLVLNCQQKKEIVVAQTYQEPNDPSPDTDQNWTEITKGMHASLVSTNIRFVKSKIPEVNQSNSWKGEAWKGERISTQLVLWSNDSITNTSIEVVDFVSNSGSKLPASIARTHFVKYVITDEFAGGCGYRKPEDFASSLAADAFDPISSYAVKAKETRPVWITIDVPHNAESGTYKSIVSLDIENQKTQQFELILHVLPKELPKATDWKFHLDLWQNPYAVARFHNVKAWSQEHWGLLKPLMKRLANAGQKVITVSLNKRPWGGQTFDQFEAMIDWKKKTDGSWEYDFTNFDNWVQFMMDLGVKKQISCYSMVPWGNEFYYFDEGENKEVKIKAPPGTKPYEDLWVPFLTAFKKHLVEKGWNNITRIAMDERGPKEMKAMLELLNEYAPEFGVSFADNHKSYKLYPNELKDMSVAFGHPVDNEDLVIRRENGYVSTHYVCCSDGFPNTFTFSAPAEGFFIGWYTMAADFDGFLRWAYNSWVENPLQDSRFRAWPAGDTYIVYPDNRSSIRFETLRDGIEDAEKIRILREELKTNNMLDELDYLNGVVAKFNITTKPDDLEGMLKDAKNTLNVLAKKLTID
ncbi:glycoside hydrolase domain-containing protein [Tamlana sp. 2201CG12-4]|uniref:DUF4091 domain-containing protein n=1 Tax=Tamlana sp. 2201CG12-4 TaxID=3112582 RepID=UPI002DBA3C63|nr:glycoside hydrolase domain-containing protein [Tamlana sp. 2201CG12-4]MEC3906674.1 glycoside hydrolase domain-containing protein [Tamlana sp. 2201CG12-4]